MGAGPKRWPWFAGGASILLFAVLLLLRLGIPDAIFREGKRAAAGRPVSISPGETWMNLTQDGRKIGYTRRSWSQTESGFRYLEEIHMRINTMGVVQPMAVWTEAELKPDRTLSSFRFDLRSNLFGFAARGTVSGRKLTLHSGAPGSEKQSIIDLAEVPYMGGGLLESVAAEEMRPGEGRSFPVFDPASLGQRLVRITLIGEETLAVSDRSLRTRKFEVDFMGMKQLAWIDEEGSIVREKGFLGIALDRVSREEALAGLGETAGGDLAEIAAVPVSKPIADPKNVRLLRVRISGIEDRSLTLDGGRQTWRDGLLTIRRESPAASSGARAPRADLPRSFLDPSPLIQSDHPKIVEALRKIVAPEDSAGTKAGKIVSWVHNNLEKRPVLSIPNALETLEQKMGDCNEHAVLVAALSRAAGIPAQVEAGLVYLNGRFYYHAWNALYLREWGGWATADAVMGQLPADATHIRFVRGEIDRHLDLLGLIGKVKMEILEVER
jgi:hypothetical protein